MILRYYHTIKFLKITQIFYRLKKILFYKIINLNKNNIKINLSKNDFYTNQFIIKNINININEGYLNVLNNKINLNHINWNDKNYSKLVIYTLNYFDFLINLDDNTEFKKNLIYSWINTNNDHLNTSWEPYPISRRIVNWIKWIKKNKITSDKIDKSIFLQTRWLNINVEYDLLGNHILSNAIALVLSGFYFDTFESNKWFEKGCRILEKELNRQFLNDGGHFERSTMYHSIIYEDLLDTYNFLNSNELFLVKNKKKIIRLIKNITFKMYEWQNYMNITKNNLSLFGDAANSNIIQTNHLFQYAANLGLRNNITEKKFKYLKESGFITFKNKNYKIILNVGNLKARYIPGHSHADSLSYELSLNDRKIITNTGVSTYNHSAQRINERSASYHNTIDINDRSFSEIWSSFRMGRSSLVKQPKILKKNNKITIETTQFDYKNYFNKIHHKRLCELENDKIIISDYLNKNIKSNSYIILNENFKIEEIEDNKLKISVDNDNVFIIQIIKGSARVEDFELPIDFNKFINTKRIIIKLVYQHSKYSIEKL